MQFNTDLYYVQHSGFGTKNFRARKHKAHWCLWFIESGNIQERQSVINCHVLSVKPTKKQLRKLRRAFRKEAAQYV